MGTTLVREALRRLIAIVFLLTVGHVTDARAQLAPSPLPSALNNGGALAPSAPVPTVPVMTAETVARQYAIPSPRAGLATNLYSYVNSNPVNFRDPSGLCREGDVNCLLAMERAGLPNWSTIDPPQDTCTLECRASTLPLSALAFLYGTGVQGFPVAAACNVGATILCSSLCTIKARQRAQQSIPGVSLPVTPTPNIQNNQSR